MYVATALSNVKRPRAKGGGGGGALLWKGSVCMKWESGTTSEDRKRVKESACGGLAGDSSGKKASQRCRSLVRSGALARHRWIARTTLQRFFLCAAQQF